MIKKRASIQFSAKFAKIPGQMRHSEQGNLFAAFICYRPRTVSSDNCY